MGNLIRIKIHIKIREITYICEIWDILSTSQALHVDKSLGASCDVLGREPHTALYWKTQKWPNSGVWHHCCYFPDLQRLQGTAATPHAQPRCTPGGKGTSRMTPSYLLELIRKTQLSRETNEKEKVMVGSYLWRSVRALIPRLPRQPLLLLVQWLGFQDHLFQLERGVTV